MIKYDFWYITYIIEYNFFLNYVNEKMDSTP